MEENARSLLVTTERRNEHAVMDRAPAEECSVPFTADSLHDLASPINQVGTMAGLLINRYGARLDGDAVALIGYLDRSTRQLQSFVEGLSRYMQAVGMPGPYRSCDGSALLEAAVGSIQGFIDTHGAVVTHDVLPELYCHPGQMTIVLANLIENSIKFRRTEPPLVHVSAMAKEDMWVISVKDNGLGIAPRLCKRVFAMFTREHEADRGAGVGLPIVRRVVENHRGRVWIESEVGCGTRVSFTLPRAG